MLLRSYVPQRYAFGRFDYPFLSIERALRQMDTTKDEAVLSVRLDVREDDKTYTVTAELPGLSESDVNVEFDDGVLSLSGEKKVEREEKDLKWHMTERTRGQFARKISLPSPITTSAIEARFENGVLTVTLPKEAAPVKATTKIAIKTSDAKGSA